MYTDIILFILDLEKCLNGDELSLRKRVTSTCLNLSDFRWSVYSIYARILTWPRTWRGKWSLRRYKQVKTLTCLCGCILVTRLSIIYWPKVCSSWAVVGRCSQLPVLPQSLPEEGPVAGKAGWGFQPCTGAKCEAPEHLQDYTLTWDKGAWWHAREVSPMWRGRWDGGLLVQ